ncbi:hypothetical protein EDD18DRAFT_177804 [Armillaria luteobubalina]|uniref:Uncharacterized protein n=1 Tax=Armillaria luteobubalina TaxID=153913 RepID=A0AA39Q8D0_9AGAR|nr:hypothetical protein EDD18DRAFT_177804 [Armillaria luteobubalina]
MPARRPANSQFTGMLAASSASLPLAHAHEVSNPFRSLRTASHQARRQALHITPPYPTPRKTSELATHSWKNGKNGARQKKFELYSHPNHDEPHHQVVSQLSPLHGPRKRAEPRIIDNLPALPRASDPPWLPTHPHIPIGHPYSDFDLVLSCPGVREQHALSDCLPSTYRA